MRRHLARLEGAHSNAWRCSAAKGTLSGKSAAFSSARVAAKSAEDRRPDSIGDAGKRDCGHRPALHRGLSRALLARRPGPPGRPGGARSASSWSRATRPSRGPGRRRRPGAPERGLTMRPAPAPGRRGTRRVRVPVVARTTPTKRSSNDLLVAAVGESLVPIRAPSWCWIAGLETPAARREWSSSRPADDAHGPHSSPARLHHHVHCSSMRTG